MMNSMSNHQKEINDTLSELQHIAQIEKDLQEYPLRPGHWLRFEVNGVWSPRMLVVEVLQGLGIKNNIVKMNMHATWPANSSPVTHDEGMLHVDLLRTPYELVWDEAWPVWEDPAPVTPEPYPRPTSPPPAPKKPNKPKNADIAILPMHIVMAIVDFIALPPQTPPRIDDIQAYRRDGHQRFTDANSLAMTCNHMLPLSDYVVSSFATDLCNIINKGYTVCRNIVRDCQEDPIQYFYRGGTKICSGAVLGAQMNTVSYAFCRLARIPNCKPAKKDSLMCAQRLVHIVVELDHALVCWDKEVIMWPALIDDNNEPLPDGWDKREVLRQQNDLEDFENSVSDIISCMPDFGEDFCTRNKKVLVDALTFTSLCWHPATPCTCRGAIEALFKLPISFTRNDARIWSHLKVSLTTRGAGIEPDFVYNLLYEMGDETPINDFPTPARPLITELLHEELFHLVVHGIPDWMTDYTPRYLALTAYMQVKKDIFQTSSNIAFFFGLLEQALAQPNPLKFMFDHGPIDNNRLHLADILQAINKFDADAIAHQKPLLIQAYETVCSIDWDVFYDAHVKYNLQDQSFKVYCDMMKSIAHKLTNQLDDVSHVANPSA